MSDATPGRTPSWPGPGGTCPSCGDRMCPHATDHRARCHAASGRVSSPWPCCDHCGGGHGGHVRPCVFCRVNEVRPPPHAGRTPSPAELRAMADEIESRGCTGMVAVWCPVHGDCRGCTRHDDGEWDEFHPSCPLHGTRTAHAAGALT